MLNGKNASVADGTEPDSTANKAEFSDHILATASVLPPLVLFIQFSNCGQHIRKWSKHHFDGAHGYTIYHAANLTELTGSGGAA